MVLIHLTAARWRLAGDIETSFDFLGRRDLIIPSKCISEIVVFKVRKLCTMAS